MTQEINLVLELDEYQEWIFSVIPSTELKSKIKALGNESFKKIKAKFDDRTLDSCEKCSEQLQINLYYYDETPNHFEDNGDEIDIEKNHWEPECIIHRQDSYEVKEIKEEPEMDIEEVDFIGFDESEEYEMREMVPERLDEETIRNMVIPKSEDKNDPKPFKCPKCEMGFVAQKNVRRHLKNNSCRFLKPAPPPKMAQDSDVFAGMDDSMNETLDDDLLRTLPIPKSTDKNDPKPFRCPKCNMGFVAQKNVRRHLKNNSCRSDDIQQGLRPYLCPNCKMRFTTRNNTKKHIARNTCGALNSNNGTEPLMADESDPKPFKCPECNIGFSCRKNVLRHLNANACLMLKGNGNKRAVDNCNAYLPKDLVLPDLSQIKPPYFESFEQSDGTFAYVSYSARHSELRVTNFDPMDLKCELCYDILKTTTDLIAHRQHTHFFPKNQPECAGCGKRCENVYEKRWHSFYCKDKYQLVANEDLT